MSTSSTSASTPPPRELHEVGTFVHDRVSLLQHEALGKRSASGQYIRRPSPAAIADLARLRRAVAKPVGACSDVWTITLQGLNVKAENDEPTVEEIAAHTAITLYAVHQQSRPDPMHHRGAGLGAAVRRLGLRDDVSSEAVDRRFAMLGTASSFTEAVHHLRALVTQLRGARITLDYGHLADQFVDLQQPWYADRVRLAWGREYHRRSETTKPPTEATTNGENA